MRFSQWLSVLNGLLLSTNVVASYLVPLDVGNSVQSPFYPRVLQHYKQEVPLHFLFINHAK